MHFARRLLPLVLMIVFGVATARAEPVKFDLAAQPAAVALAAFAKQAGVEVLYSFDALKTVPANAVVGLLEPEEALALLLRGTGFVGTRIGPKKFVVVRERADVRTVVSGRVTNRFTAEPIAGATVRALGSAVAVLSDANGAFFLPDVPVEVPAIVVQADGFATARVSDLRLLAHRRMEVGEIALRPHEGAEPLEEMVVRAGTTGAGVMPFLALDRMVVTPSRFGLDQERGALAATLTETELQALPQLGEDLYRAIARLPGLAADDYTAKFWVRGAPHEQVLARLDGVKLIEPFHMKDTDSSLSIVDLESINRLELHTGGFSVPYGDRLGGVLLMETDTHVRARPRTTLGVSMTGARLGSRGQTANGRSRWLLNARTGYPDIALEDADDDTKLKMRYYDVTAKWEFSLTPSQTLSLHALHSGDSGRYTDDLGMVLKSRYGSDYAWVRWRGSLGERVTGEAVLSYAGLSWWREGAGRVERQFAAEVRDDRTLKGWSLRQDWNLGLSDRALLSGGMELESGEASYDYRGGREVGVLRDGVGVAEWRRFSARLAPDGRAIGGYVSARVQPWERLTLEPGVRYDTNDWADDSNTSPRLSAAWNFGASTVRGAWGLYHQAQGLHELGVLDRDTSFRPSERAEHRVLSLEHRLARGVNLRIEGYERLVTRPRVHWGNTITNMSAFPELTDDRTRFDPVRQRARGVEVIAERRGGGKWGWTASYAFAKAEETLRDGRTIPRARDQRHTLYLDAAYSPNPRWQFSAAWQSHTGWPTTDEVFSFVTLANGERIIFAQPGAVYATRLPAYQRLDLRAQRRFELKRGTLRAYVDVFNVLDRKNVIEYDYGISVRDGQIATTRVRGDDQIGRLPTIGLAWDF